MSEHKSILDIFLGRECPACGQLKGSERAFCYGCYGKLPQEMKDSLWARFGAGFEEAFKKSLDWLKSPKPATTKAEKAKPPVIKWPATSDELRKAGYMYSSEGPCRGCGEPIEWWITPAGRNMPISIQKAENVLFDSGEKRISHFAVCPEAKTFRKGRSNAGSSDHRFKRAR